MRLYVGNLSFNTDEPQLTQLFASLGEVVSVRLIRDRETGQSRGFGFVEMADSSAGQKACDSLNQQEFDQLVKEARDEGFGEIADWFETLAKAERSHANRFQKALDV